MWLFLFVVFVLTVIGFFLWSYHAAYEQKRAWKAFAMKNNLQFAGGQMMDAPSMTGLIKGRQVNFYPQIIETPQGQKQMQNVVEVFFNLPPDIICVIAKPGFVDFVSQLDMPETFMIEHSSWPQNAMARTLIDEAPEIWFGQSESRVKAIENLFKLPFDVTFFSDTQEAFLALRTSNPLDSAEKINKLVNAMFKVIDVLEVEVALPENTEDVTENSEDPELNT